MRDLFAATLLVGALAVALTWPGPAGFDAAVAARADTDVWNTMWLTDAVAKSLLSGGPPLEAHPALEFPGTIDLWPHLGGILWPALLAPLSVAVGPIVTHNASGILALALTTLAFYWLFRRASGNHGAALGAAILVGCGAYSVEEIHYGNPELAAFFTVPLAALGVLRVLDRGRVADRLVAGAALGLAFAFNPYFGLVAAVFTVCAAAACVKSLGTTQALARFAPVAVIAALVALPAAIPVLRGTTDAAYRAASQAGFDAAGASWDLLEPVFLSRTYPGTIALTLLVVALAGAYRAPAGFRFWLGSALVFYLLALGPSVHVFGHDTHVPGPFRLVGLLPGGWRLHYAYRFAIGFHLCLGAAAALTFRRLIEAASPEGPRRQVVARVPVLAAVALAALAFAPVATPVSIPPVYAEVVRRDTPGAVLELPFSHDFYANSRRLFYQSAHGRPILVGRPLPDLPPDFGRRGNLLYEALTTPGEDARRWPTAEELPSLVGELSGSGVNLAIVHHAAPGAFASDFLLRGAFGEPVWRDAGESLYDLRHAQSGVAP